MIIYVKTTSTIAKAIDFPLEVKTSDSIRNVKHMILEEKDIPISKQMLIFQGKQLDDKCTVGDYCIQDKSTIHLMTCTLKIWDKGLMKIFVKTFPSGGTIALDVRSSETIGFLKKKIYKKEGIAESQQRLMFRRRWLEDGHTLDNYDIGRESTLELVRVW